MVEGKTMQLTPSRALADEAIRPDVARTPFGLRLAISGETEPE
jgi:hypothetical protein